MPRALITGCSTGIGRATAVEMARRGYEVVATARKPETIRGLDVALRLRLDVDDDRSVKEAFEASGDLDILVNNAAWEVAGPVELVPIDRVRAMFETNVFGVLRTVHAVAPQFRARGRGTIVNVSSTTGRIPLPFSGTYSAAKHAIEAISETLHYELGHFGIRVVIIEPGSTGTAWASNEEWHGVDSPPYDELYRQEYGQRPGPEQLTPPEMVANVIIEAIESETHRLRWPTTARVEAILGARARMTDEEFEAQMRQWLEADW